MSPTQEEKTLKEYSQDFVDYGDRMAQGHGLPWPDRVKLLGKCLWAVTFLITDRSKLIQRIEVLEKKK